MLKRKEPKVIICKTKGCDNVFKQFLTTQNKCIPCLVENQKAADLKKQKLEEKKLITKYKENTTNYSKILQDNINKIVRLIDKGQPCLARGNKPKQIHAGHVFARGGNPSIRYNLHNIHRQSAQSNHYQNDDGILKEGLVKEYGQDYMTFISELRRTKALNYSNIQYKHFNELALDIIRMLVKKDCIYSLAERISLRNEINNTLEIYPREFCEFAL